MYTQLTYYDSTYLNWFMAEYKITLITKCNLKYCHIWNAYQEYVLAVKANK